MSSPREYRAHVTECMERAKKTNSDVERTTYLEMAKAWLEAAVQADIPVGSRQPTERSEAAEPYNDGANSAEAIIQWNCVLEAVSLSRAR